MEKGVVDPAAVDRVIEHYESDVGPLQRRQGDRPGMDRPGVPAAAARRRDTGRRRVRVRRSRSADARRRREHPDGAQRGGLHVVLVLSVAAEAKTTFGRIGVKVWINKGEIMPEGFDGGLGRERSTEGDTSRRRRGAVTEGLGASREGGRGRGQDREGLGLVQRRRRPGRPGGPVAAPAVGAGAGRRVSGRRWTLPRPSRGHRLTPPVAGADAAMPATPEAPEAPRRAGHARDHP